VFDLILSVEKDTDAHRTLELRTFFRQFDDRRVPDDYYRYVRKEINRDDLFGHYPAEADAASRIAWKATLGAEMRAAARRRVDEALRDREGPWVLIGGPPCQAYSLIGRPKLRSLLGDDFDKDHRHTLYKEYLQIIADHSPAIFVMENVKGLLSARANSLGTFRKIRDDLQRPGRAIGDGSNRRRYVLRGLAQPLAPGLFNPDDLDASDFVLKFERYGVPQSRHRVILLGIRDDVLDRLEPGYRPPHIVKQPPVDMWSAISGLPALRSGLSKEPDSDGAWIRAVAALPDSDFWLKIDPQTRSEIQKTIAEIKVPESGRGGEFVASSGETQAPDKWIADDRLRGVANHSSRGHMASDLARYLYASCFGKAHGKSPKLADFPRGLLPNHANATIGSRESLFSDRFRVQIRGKPATTVTSHIAKDGHYYIHPDPLQCRSLTVREAARLQTFPDNYFFEGGRTAQYSQVGNAVPPLVARQIAGVVADCLTALRAAAGDSAL